MELFLSMDGRIGRGKFWLGLLGLIVANFVLASSPRLIFAIAERMSFDILNELLSLLCATFQLGSASVTQI